MPLTLRTVAVGLLVGACSLVGARSSTTIPPPAPTSATTAPTSTTVPTSTSVISTELTTTECAASPEEFQILCEAVDLIDRHYVGDFDETVLAEAAEQGVEELTNEGSRPGPFTCPLPNPAFLQVCEEIDQRDADPAEAAEAAIAGITLYALDVNSTYLDPQSLALAQEEQSGQVEGIGALVSPESTDSAETGCQVLGDTCRLVIIAPLENSPAERAGLQPGDAIVSIDGTDVTGMSVDDATARVRGPAGTDVVLGILRDEEVLEVAITRAAIEIPVVESEVIGDTGYLRLNIFSDNADEQVRSTLGDLLERGVERIVLDLRNNPGGTLPAAVRVASEFLADGLVLRTQAPDDEIEYEVESGGVATDPDLEVLVLVNGGSASASEVVAGALQEAGRAVVIGEPTFGKNTVQQRFSLSNGGALKLTIARWVTPGGLDFGETGIIPDITAQLAADLPPDELVAQVVALTDPNA